MDRSRSSAGEAKQTETSQAVVCPWSVLESRIACFKNEATLENFERILKTLDGCSSHGDFWERVFLSYEYINKYEKAKKLIEYLENENEKLNEFVELNVRKNTSK
jgi:hypothetical protein